MNTPDKVPVPVTLKFLIQHSNELLQNYQRDITERVTTANRETMAMLGLNPDDGWRLDMETFTYVKVKPNDTPVNE